MKKILLLVFLFLFTFVQILFAEDEKQKDKSSSKSFNPTIYLALKYGLGVYNESSTKIGEHREYKYPIEISGSGCESIALHSGFFVNDNIVLDIGYINQTSRPPRLFIFMVAAPYTIDNYFSRSIYLFTIKHLIKTNTPIDNSRFFWGYGVGYYTNMKLEIYEDIYTSTNKNIAHYSDTLGYHILGQYEILFSDKWAINIELKYYMVEYKQKRVEGDAPILKEPSLIEVNGNGADLIFGIVRYF